MPECRIESGVTDPIVGNSPVFSTTTTRTYGTNLMFEPVPLEMLYTDAQQPQVMVKVNGIEGVCPSFNCDYTYVDSTSLITSQSISGDILTILGTNLPTAGVRVALANSVCDTVSASPTQITCTLTTPAAAGSWDVQVTDSSGLIPIDSTIAQISIALTLTGVSPASGLNQLGGDILTLSGTGLDQIMDGTSVDFSDGTTCQIQSTSATQLTCMIDGFDSTTLNTVNPYTLTVTVNGVVDSTQSVTILSTK